LPVIGSHCSACNDLDLLPIRCLCGNLFCRHHISPESHGCSFSLASSNPVAGVPFEKLERCAADKCNKPSLESFIGSSSDENGRLPATCPHCGKAFCVSHRHPKSHLCSVPEFPPSNKNVAGQKLLAIHFPSTSATTPAPCAPRAAKIPSDPKKRAQLQRVELIKMRHRAIPGDPRDKPSSIVVDQRLHVKVKLDHPEHPAKEGMFWFRKTVGTGRALDLLATHLAIPPSDESPRQLLKISVDLEECTPLRNDQPLSSQVEEGCTLVLSIV